MLKITSFIVSILCAVSPVLAKEYYVKNQTEYRSAEQSLKAGDTIILANGVWQDFEILMSAKGSAQQPIMLRSETPGKVIISGQSNLRISGHYIIVKGLIFRNGFSPTSEVISFRNTDGDLAYNSRVTEVVVDHFNKPDRFDNDYWVALYGSNNRFDHNNLVGKSNKGVTLAVRLNDPASRKNNHRIDYNYFGPRPVLGSNGAETLRIGTSKYAEFNSNTIVENNFFDRCDGEVEIISSKSGGNIIRGNVFFESSGTVTLRHGDNNLVERNIFLGNGKDHSGGIRVINRNQTVRENYMEGLRGDGFASAFTVMNGVPNSPVNRYVQVSNAKIEHNSIFDSSTITFAGGADAERSAAPIDSVMRANLFDNEAEFRVQDDISGIMFISNLRDGDGSGLNINGITTAKLDLVRAENGLLYPRDPKYSDLGAPRDLKPIKRDDVGAKWYLKPALTDRFDTGMTMNVPTTQGALFAALNAANDGDILLIADGDHIINKTLELTKAVTIKGAGSSRLLFDRPSLFVMSEGGSLKLDRLTIDGDLAPDSVGNSVIRTSSYPIQSNFMIELHNVKIANLSVNRSFDVIKLGKSSFADRILIKDSVFNDISGSILLAAAETEDYGQYNAEYVDINQSAFTNIGGPLVNLYRGGRDESTFGPHFNLSQSALINVGASSGNTSGSSLLLHGVQYSAVTQNSFVKSAPIKINHTVGRPDTNITKNSFVGTPKIQIAELNYKGQQRAILEDNLYDQGESE